MEPVIKKNGFTLIEVIVGIVIVAIISVACFTTVSLLTRSTETSRNAIIATNLMQKSMEEVRRVAESNFDDLNSCSFPIAGPTGDACGFEEIQTAFPDYTRTLTVSNAYAISEELKKVIVQINWNDMGKARELKSMILLSRPPDPLPGNIYGVVYREGEPASIINGAEVTIKLSASTDEEKSFSTNSLSAEGTNYDFKEPVSGQYVLTAGTWTMSVEKEGYADYIHPTSIYVPPGGPSVRVDIPLTPLPEPATITYQLVDRLTNANLGGYNYYSWVRLRTDSTLYDERRNDTNHAFTINFPEPTDPSFQDPQCFTLYTDDAFRSARAYQTNSLGAPSCPYNYNSDGWSSACVQEDNSLTCGNAYTGESATDRICVSPGDAVNVTIPLDSIPAVTVTGQISGLASGEAGRVYIYWPSCEGRPYYTWYATDNSGNFSIQIPAAQELWGNSNPAQNYMWVRPQGPVPYQGCCDNAQTTGQYGDYVQVGPLWAGSSAQNIGILPLPVYGDLVCGNVEGEIRDAKTNANINGATITLRGDNEITSLGQYLYDCPSSGYRLSQGNNQTFYVSHADYYNFQSNGNVQYRSRAGTTIAANSLTAYDASLWPKGYGTVYVTVVDASTTSPVENVDVTLLQYNGVSYTGTTDENGLVTFFNVLETWPPSALPVGDSNYNYDAQDHTVTAVSVSAGNYIFPVSETVSGLSAGGTLNIIISIFPEGAM